MRLTLKPERFNELSVCFPPIADIRSRRHALKMRSVLFATIMVCLPACGSTGPWPRTPDARLADEIEAKLSQVRCVGSIGHWERHYNFRSKPSLLASLISLGTSDRWFDYRTIDIGYYQAGFEEFRARRFLYKGVDERRFDVDDRDYNVVFGHFDIPTHTVSLWACGPNMGGSSDVNINVR